MPLKKVGTKVVAEGAGKYVGDTEKAAGATNQFSKALKGLGIIALGIGAAKAIAGIGREALGAVAAHEQLAMSMTSLVSKELRAADSTLDMATALDQAADRAQELLIWIQDLAIISPFSQQGVAQAFRTALAYGFTSKEAQRLTAATIDFATATGQSVEVMNRVSLALGQIKAKGKLAGQEILQLVNAGFSVNPVLEQMGFTLGDVRKGLIRADDFLIAFTETLERDFGGAAERSATTINGLIDSLRDLRQIGLRELFGPAIQAMLPGLAMLVSKVREFMPAIAMAGEALGNFTKKLIENKGAILAAAAGFGIFLLVINASTIASIAVTVLTAAVGGLIAVIGILLSPIGILAAALGAITIGLITVSKQFDTTEQDAVTAMEQMADSTDNLSGRVERGLAEPGEKSHGWGYNLIMNFAQGMADAIGKVLEVLTSLARTITSWLSPGSPPKILPDIDKWGTAAMQEYVDGFTKADFGVFSQISGTIEKFLRAAPGTGDDKEGMIGQIIGSREAIMEALSIYKDVGSVSEEAFQGIFEAAGLSDGAMQDYVRAAFEAAAATDAVKAAQEALNEIQERYSDLLSPLRDELTDIHKEKQQMVRDERKEELEAILARARAEGNVEAERRALMNLREIELQNQIATIEEAAAAEIEGAEEVLETAVDQQEAAQMQLDQQQALIDIQIQNNQLLAEQAGLVNDLADALGSLGAGGAGGGVAAITDALGDLPALAEAGGIAFGGMKKNIEDFVEGLKTPFKNLQGLWDEFKLSWAEVGLAFITKLQPMTAAINAAWGPGGTWEGNMNLLKIMSGQLTDEWGKQWGEGGTWHGIMRNASLIVSRMWGEGGYWDGIIENAKTSQELLKEKWVEIWGEDGTWHNIIKMASQIITDHWGEDGFWEVVFQNLADAMNLLANTAVEWLRSKVESLTDAIRIAMAVLGELLDKLENFSMPSVNLPGKGKTSSYSVPTTQGQVAANAAANTYQNNNKFAFNNTINNGMDAAMMNTQIMRTVNNALL